MAEASVIIYDFKELAALMVKDQKIKEGLWSVYVKFGIKAANLGPNPEDVRPTAIVPVLELGLQKTDQQSNLTVDAALVGSPAKKKAAKKS